MDDQLITEATNAEQVNPLYPSLPISERWRGVVSHHEAHGRPGDNTTQTAPRQTSVSSAVDVSSVQAHVDMLLQQREELISINKKWAAQYKVMTQYYKGKVREPQPSVQTFQPTHPLNEGQSAEEETDLKAETEKSRTDAEQLRSQNVHLTKRGQDQWEEIQRLNQALHGALESRFVCGESTEEPHDNVWKHQAEVYKEDFLRERKDRERLKDQLINLEKKYKKTHNELSTLKSKVTWAPVVASPVVMCNCSNRGAANNYNTHPPAGNQWHHNHRPQSGS